jgi:hypothetical protein
VSAIVLRDASNDAKDLLRWKVARGPSTTMRAFGDPVGGVATIRLCVYDASAAPQPLVVAAVGAGGTCGRKPCWKVSGNGGYRYRDRAGASGGVTDVKLRTTPTGEAQLLVKGRGVTLPMPSLELSLPVTAQLVIGDTSATVCWEAVFGSALRNEATLFKARAP